MSSWDLTPYDKKLIIGSIILVVVVVGGCLLMRATAAKATPTCCPSKPPRAASLMAATSHHEQNMFAQGQGHYHVAFIDGDKLAEVESGKEPAVVFYYSTKCGYCHKALPNFLSASDSVKPDIHLYAVEASNVKTENPLVKGFPTVILYGLPGGQKPEAVVGARSANDYTKIFDRYDGGN